MPCWGIMDKLPKAFGLEIKHRSLPPNPWRWEIYRKAESLCVEQSEISYASQAAALAAGHEAFRDGPRGQKNQIQRVGPDDRPGVRFSGLRTFLNFLTDGGLQKYPPGRGLTQDANSGK